MESQNVKPKLNDEGFFTKIKTIFTINTYYNFICVNLRNK